MPRLLLRTAAFALALAAPSVASAQFGQGIIVGADRLWGVGVSRVTTTVETPTGDTRTTATATEIRALYSGAVAVPSSGPRLSGDLGIGGGLTVGGALGFSRVSGPSVESCTTVNGAETCAQAAGDTSAQYSLTVSPRAGFMLHLTRFLHVWPRAGITYSRNWLTGVKDASGKEPEASSTFGGTLEGLGVFTPNPNLGFTLGPVIDYTPISNQNDGTQNTTALYVGLVSGVVGQF